MGLVNSTIKWAAAAIVAAATLAVLVSAVVSHVGRTHLAEVKAGLIAEGEKLTLAEMLPTHVPDHLNLFEDQVWRPADSSGDQDSSELTRTPLALAAAPLTDAEIAQGTALFGPDFFSDSPPPDRLWVVKEILFAGHSQPLTTEQALWVLEVLKPFDSLMDQIASLLDRPFARFRQGNNILTNEVFRLGGGLSYVARVLRPRAFARLAIGDSGGALADIHTMGRLIMKTAAEPSLYMEMLRLYLAICIEGIAREGLAKRTWSEPQLETLEATLQNLDVIRGIANAFRAERGAFNQYLEELHLGQRPLKREDIPTVFAQRPFGREQFLVYLKLYGPSDQAILNRDIQSLVELLDQSKRSGVDDEVLGRLIKPNNTGVLRDRFFFFLAGNVHVAIEHQTALDQTRIACALERYRIRQGSYPSELSLLVPDFLQSLPPDRYSLEPINYKLLDSGRFELTARDGEQTIRWSNAPTE